jgi:predicted permease
MRLIHRIQYLLRQSRHERELAEEIESHRQMIEDRQRAAGLSEQDARHAAHRLMGNATLAREDSRGVWITAWVQSVFQDLGYAARSLRSQPGFTALALLALALGTGVNTSLFTVYNALTLRPWPVRHPGSVVRVSSRDVLAKFSLAEYRHLSADSHAFAGLAIESGARVSLDEKGDEPDDVIQFVGGNYFTLLGVDMALGRGFTATEDRMGAPEAVAVLSFDTWQTRYGGDPGILGRRIRLNDIPFTVIGVVNKDFSRAMPGGRLWAPLASQPLVDPAAKVVLASTGQCCFIVGRLAPGVSREQARAELLTLSRQFHSQIGYPPHDITLFGTALLDRGGTEALYQLFAMLMAAFGSVLLLACANVGNLLLARAAARQREIAVRVSIGAGRARLVRQLLTESLLLSSLGSGLGLLLAYMLPSVVQKRMALMQGVDLTPDPNVLAYSIGIAVLSAVLLGLAPALRATRISVSEAMKQQGAHASPRFQLRGLLLSVQVAISVTLLLGAGLLTRALWHARSLDLGYKIEGVTAITVNLPARAYDLPRRRAFFDAVLQQLRPFGPVGVGEPPPGGGTLWAIQTRDKTMVVSLVARDVNADYFSVLGIPIVAGRNLVPADRELHNVLINETMARRYWPGQTPIGKSVLDGSERREVVGVVRDSQLDWPSAIPPTFFRYTDSGGLLVPSSVGSIATGAIRQTEPRARVTAAPLSDQLERRLESPRAAAQVAFSLGALALLLATIGVYGVISYSVEQRRREIGIRMALGARSGEILGLVLRSNARPVMVGLFVGLVVSLAGSRVLESFLYGMSRLDPLAYGAVLAVLLVAAAAASAIPARLATRIAPVEALRQD